MDHLKTITSARCIAVTNIESNIVVTIDENLFEELDDLLTGESFKSLRRVAIADETDIQYFPKFYSRRIIVAGKFSDPVPDN